MKTEDAKVQPITPKPEPPKKSKLDTTKPEIKGKGFQKIVKEEPVKEGSDDKPKGIKGSKKKK